MTRARSERFWSQVDRRGPDECWPFLGYLDVQGYGRTRYDGRKEQAHRAAWIDTHGPIPDGHDVDHVAARGCTLRSCCNPAHLEPVTHQVNFVRSSHPNAVLHRERRCCRGHVVAGENVYLIRDGARIRKRCRTCRLDQLRRMRAA